MNRVAGERPDRGERGYAMITLLVAISLMGVFMSAALPVWRQQMQREKEAELVWRGEQYDRAIQLYRQRHGAPGPPNVDVLVKEKLLRRKYKDPITGKDFELRTVGPSGAVESAEAEQQGRGSGRVRRPVRRPGPSFGPGRTTGRLIGGVRSTSTERSIRVLNGKQRYNEWEFAYVPYQDSQAVQTPAATPSRPGLTPRTRGNQPPPRPGRPQR